MEAEDRIAIESDADARYAHEVVIDVSGVTPRVSLPHAPDNVVGIEEAIGIPVHMVFIGTCTGGRLSDLHSARDVLARAGGRVDAAVHLVVTPASEEVRRQAAADGTLDALVAMGATVTTPGCGAC